MAEPSTSAIPVIAVSASAWEDVRAQATDAGCVDFLPKPVKADVLFAKLQRFTGARFVSPASEPDAPLPSLREVGGDIAARIREAAAIGNVEELDALAGRLSAAGDAPGSLGRRIAALTAAFDYDALLRLADSLEQPR